MTNLPAYLRPVQGALVDQMLGNLGTGTPPYLSIEGNRFTLVDAAGAEEPVTTVDPKTGLPYVDCVIVDGLERESKIFYLNPFVKGTNKPPECWSDNGIGPSRLSSVPQHPTCGTCPNAAWGSAISAQGKGVPACRKYQKLALMIPGDEVTFLLRVPPNSLGNLRDYLLKCKKHGIAVQHLITRISFIKEALGTLTFWSPGYISEPMAQQSAAVMAAGQTGLLLGRGDQPREGLIAGGSSGLAPGTGVQLTVAAPPAAQAAQQGAPAVPTNGPQAAPAASVVPTNGPQTAEPARRRRRTQAEMQAANAQPAAPAPGPQTAPFRPEPSPIAAAPAAAHQNGGTFGIQNGVAPDPELSAAIDSIFGPPA